MEESPCLFLGIKVKPGPIERHKLENYTLENTVDSLKSEVEKKTLVPSTSLELIHHGKILKDGTTLQDSGVKNGEMVHVVKKKEIPAPEEPRQFTDSDLQQIVTALWTFGCTPNAPGWARAMQILNNDSIMQELVDAIPSLAEDCVTTSILHEVELLAAMGATVQTMRRGTDARPDLPLALRHLIRLVRSRSPSSPFTDDALPTSGFAYSLEALSEDEDEAEDDGGEETERHTITQEHLNAALQAASEAVSESGSTTSTGGLLRLLNFANSGASQSSTPNAAPSTPGGSSRPLITPEMFSEAMTQAMTNAQSTRNSPMDQSPASSTPVSSISSQSLTSTPVGGAAISESYLQQLNHMHEMGLLDDALNIRALIISSGDVNAAINLVFSGAIGDD